jgi:hypothetical protein
LTQAEIAQDFYCFEIFWYDFWLRKGLEPIRLKYFQFSDYNIIRNEKDYGIATQNAKQKQAEVDGIKINLVNNANENIVFNLPNEQEHTKAPVRSVQLLKIKRELLKIFPYFLVKQKIERLDRKICELKGQSR